MSSKIIDLVNVIDWCKYSILEDEIACPMCSESIPPSELTKVSDVMPFLHPDGED